jgi:hypothetical protein
VRPAVGEGNHERPAHRAVFARELLALGPWTSATALKRAHQRGVLQQGIHWDWLGGVRVYYVERILPGLVTSRDDQRDAAEGDQTDAAETTAERLRRVLADLAPRASAPRMAQRRARRAAPARDVDDRRS